MPIAKEAKSTAFEPLIIEVEAAFVHETAGGALWYMKGRSWVLLFFFLLLCLRFLVMGIFRRRRSGKDRFCLRRRNKGEEVGLDCFGRI